jgi:Asp-tRNA(Asn)/Glu-tRNA(Gln) amidotransferase A subunit family amidase
VTTSGESLLDVAQVIKTGQVSPVELAERALRLIAEQDPHLGAFQLVLEERALAAARQAEHEQQSGTYRGPLHGVPLAVKDLLAMRGTPTTAGSKILADWVPDYDAAVVERLQAAGATIVGKTRMSEFAYWPGSANQHYGPTHNPHNLDHDTGGSSSGSAAAVAAGLIYGALGTDTGGSIRMPAAQCGIVGLKPTFGLISLYGGVPLAWSLDHVGPMTRTVADAAVMMDALVGYDPRDSRTRVVPTVAYGDTVQRTDPSTAMRARRIGVLRDDGSGASLATSEGLAAWQSGLAALEASGATLIELDLPELDLLRSLNATLLVLEAVAYHQPMLRERLDDFGPIPRRRLLAAYAYSPFTFVRAQQVRATLRRKLTSIFEQVDLLSTPAMPGPAPKLGEAASVAFTGPFNALGWPAITVPVGTAEGGLPLGLQLVGRPWDDIGVLLGARAVEAALSDR